MSMKILGLLLLISIAINALLLNVKMPINSTDEQTQLSYAISDYKGDPEVDLIHVISQTKKELNIAIYNMDNTDIAEAIAEAAKRGVAVKIIADGEDSAEENQEVLLTVSNKEFTAEVTKKFNDMWQSSDLVAW